MAVEHGTLSTMSPVAQAGEWTVLRSLRWPGRWFPSVARVLVGPTGVFVIAAHPTTADVAVGEDVVQVGGRPDVHSVTAVTDAALVVAQEAGPYAAHVEPVLCFTSTPVRLGRAGGVLCSSVYELVGWLTRQPAVLAPRQVDDVVTRLRAALRAEVDREPARSPEGRPVVGTLPPSPRSGSSVVPSRGPAAARRWLSGIVPTLGGRLARAGLMTKAAVLTLATVAMLAFGIGTLNPVGSAIGRWFSQATTPATCPAAGPAAGTATGLPQSPSSAAPTPSARMSGTAQAIQLAQNQLRSQWTMSRQAFGEAEHPLCRPQD